MIGPVVAFAILRLGMRLELAPEYDSNANRAGIGSDSSFVGAAGARPVASFLLRGALRGRLAYSAGPWDLKVGVDGGTKYFFSSDARTQDMAVLRVLVDGARRFEHRGAISIGADYLDSFQWNDCPNALVNGKSIADTSCHRDLRLANVRLGASLSDGIPSLGIEGAVRRYEWKPDPDLSFTGISASLSPAVRLRRGEQLEPGERQEYTLGLAGRIEWRRYDGIALASLMDLGNAAEHGRRDLVASLGLSLAYSGPVLASAAWLVETAHSNSADGSYLYQMLTLRLAVPLPGRLTVAGRVQLLFFSAGQIARSLAAEEENRDSVLLDLARDMGAGISLSARYVVYRAATGDSTQPYLRQVASLSLSYQLDR